MSRHGRLPQTCAGTATNSCAELWLRAACCGFGRRGTSPANVKVLPFLRSGARGCLIVGPTDAKGRGCGNTTHEDTVLNEFQPCPGHILRTNNELGDAMMVCLLSGARSSPTALSVE